MPAQAVPWTVAESQIEVDLGFRKTVGGAHDAPTPLREHVNVTNVPAESERDPDKVPTNGPVTDPEMSSQ
jgi:hypothetical protein